MIKKQINFHAVKACQILICIFTAFFCFSKADAQWQKQNVETKASLRGLSVVNQNVVWASGTNGTFVRTNDGGKTWKVGHVPGADKLDFRDVEAFNANTAYLLSIGSGETSRIYKTTDGGQNWTLQYQNTNQAVFLDAFAFWDPQHGIAMGDPVNNHFYLLVTNNGGKSWTPLSTDKMPAAIEGEAAFAASGTCIVTNGKSDVYIVTGGKAARAFRSNDRGKTWSVSDTPIVNGESGSGIFSIAMFNAQKGIIVGGNYQKPNEPANNLALTSDNGKTWVLGNGLSGYRSGVAPVDSKVLVAVGSSGSDISTDAGKSWKNLDKENYNAVAAKGSDAIWAVGANGLIAKFKIIK
jgi:photosystem II stability/assembly factor-like uncharacterized protein